MIILHFMAIGLATLLGFLGSRLHQKNDLLNSNVLTLPPAATPQLAEIPILPYQTTDWIDVVDVHTLVNNSSSSSSWFLVNSCRPRPVYQVVFSPLCPVLNEVPKINIHEGIFPEDPQELSLQEDVVSNPEPELPQPKSSWIPRPGELLIIGLLVVPMLVVKIFLSVESSYRSDGQIDNHDAKARALQEDLVAHKEIAREAGGEVLELESSYSHLKQQVSHLKSFNEELRSELDGVLQLQQSLEELYSQQSETGKQLQFELEHKETVIRRLQSRDKEQATDTKSDGQTQTDDWHARQELEAKQSELDAIQSEVNTLQEELARATEDREYVERDHAQTTRSLEQVQKKLDDEKATHKTTKENHRSCAATLEKETKSKRVLEQANNKLTSELKECKESAQKKDNDLKELRSTNQTATLKNEITAVQKKLEASEKSNSSLRADIQLQQGQLKHKDDALNKFSSEASALEHQIKTIEAKKKDVDMELEILSQRYTKLEGHVANLEYEKACNENLVVEQKSLKTELRKSQETLKSQFTVQDVQAAENKRVQGEVEELKNQRTKDHTKVKNLTAQLQHKEVELQASQAANERMIKPEVLAAEKERIDELEALVGSQMAWNDQLQNSQSLQEQLQRDYEGRISILEAENNLLRKRAIVPTGPNYRRIQRERSTSRQASNYPEESSSSSSSSPEGPTTAEPFVFESGSALNEAGVKRIAMRNPDDPPANPESPTTATALSLDDDDAVDGVEAGARRRFIRVNLPPQPFHVDSSQSSLEPSGQSLEIGTNPDVEEDGKSAKQDASTSSQQIGHDKISSTSSESTAAAAAAVSSSSSSSSESHIGSTESIPAPVDQPATLRAGSEDKGLESSRFAPAAPVDHPASPSTGFGSKGLESSGFAPTASKTAEPPKASTETKGSQAKGLAAGRFARPEAEGEDSQAKNVEDVLNKASATPENTPQAGSKRTSTTPKGLESSRFAGEAASPVDTLQTGSKRASNVPKGLEGSRFAGESATPENTPQPGSKRTSTTPKGLESGGFAREAATPEDTPQSSKRTSNVPKGLEGSIFAGGAATPEDNPPVSKRASRAPKGLESSRFSGEAAKAAIQPETETKVPATEGLQTGGKEKAVKTTTTMTAKDPDSTTTAVAAETPSPASTKGLAVSRWASETTTGSSKETTKARRASKPAATSGADNNNNKKNNKNNNPGSQGAGANRSKRASTSDSRSRSRGRSSRIPRRQEPAGSSNTSTPKSDPSPSRSSSAQGLGDKP